MKWKYNVNPCKSYATLNESHKINFILTWFTDCVYITKFAIKDTKPYVPVGTLSTQDNAYRIYSSERPGCSFNFEFSKGELIRGRRSFEGGTH